MSRTVSHEVLPDSCTARYDLRGDRDGTDAIVVTNTGLVKIETMAMTPIVQFAPMQPGRNIWSGRPVPSTFRAPWSTSN